MISLEQVNSLESRVEKAVALIASLRSENASMRSGLTAAESRVAELEGLIQDFQKDQARIEEGIVEALRKLDSFEDSVHVAVAAKEPLKTVETEKPGHSREAETEKAELPSSGDGTETLDIF